MRGFCLSLVLILVGGVAVAELPLIPAVPVGALPAPLPQVQTATVGVEWANGQRETTINVLPTQAAAGAPAGALVWTRTVPDIGTSLIILAPNNQSPTGWVIYGFLFVASDNLTWVIPAQPWTPGNNNNYTAHKENDQTVTATAKVYLGGD